ncbi:MAG: hypothetical protein IM507_13520 [Microcystis sp. M20BS1]|uniref:D-Ala-D-Ala carboxypeptidase family metallohydrolase n=1 Tax=Microcystis sp. M20BS1 TaxID=2771181 RepID=UPI00257B97A6|nr:D-Ala-D-Ala carboxypeptidase family metallohydrolase [Microcystis sp. M20BS1]MCA2633363.1 hypothetical protein [Microcystis sp. M20BS1]
MLKDIKGTVKIEDLSEEQIRELQRRLGIQQTGIMGPMTRKAWEDWKRSKGMGEPGLIGPGSIGLLLEDIDWTDMTSKVSKYFTVREVTKGQAARIPTSKVIQGNIVRLAKELDNIREEWDKPIIVTSWYRPRRANRVREVVRRTLVRAAGVGGPEWERLHAPRVNEGVESRRKEGAPLEILMPTPPHTRQGALAY